ncbi:MAG TPA: ABA4-like family protein [Woeseiaceae bacterium]|nr:ABA4-like family protein [Woeseiaceae bacterium]
MSADSLFSFASTLVLPGWLLLVLLPRWKYSATLVAAVVIPALLGLLYAWLIVSHIGSTDGGFGSLAEVRALFSNEFLLLAGWIHYLAFDLFIGSWEVRDAQRHGVHHLAVIPCLVLTFLFGPVGLMLYFVIRTGVTRRILLANGA